MDRGAVEAFVSRGRAVLSDSPEMGVRNTELRLVEPFLALLDWDVRSGDVEAAFEAANDTMVDYALRVGSTPVVFVGVEPATEPVSTDGRRTLLAAMRASNVPRGIYTNGRTFELLAASGDQTREARSDADGESLDERFETVQLELEALPENLSALEAVSFEAARQLSKSDRRRAAERLVVADEDAVDAVTETIVDLCGANVAADVEPLVRTFLEATVEELAPNLDPATLEATIRTSGDAVPRDDVDEGSRRGAGPQDETPESVTKEAGAAGEQQPNADTARAPSESAPAQSGPDDTTDQSELTGSEQADTEYVVRFFEDGRSVAAVGNPSVDSAMAQAIEYLLRERGLGHRLQFPYAPAEDGTAFLHRAPRHPDGRDMQSWRDLDELALYTGQAVGVKQERVRTLAERVGLRVMFSGDWP